ncbi:OmpA family protein [Halomonas denitrificans]|nr:OmpA family protein [Halomonas denitrificans]
MTVNPTSQTTISDGTRGRLHGMSNHRYPLIQILAILAGIFLSASVYANGNNPISRHIVVGIKGGYHVGIDQNYQDSEPGSALLGVFGAMQLSHSWRWELGYQHHDALVAEASGVSVQTKLIESALRYDWYWHKDASLYGRAGLAYWNMEKTAATSSVTQDITSWSPLLEVGLNYRLTPKLHLSGGYQYLDAIGQSKTGKYDSHAIVLGLNYRFGRQLALPPTRLPPTTNTHGVDTIEHQAPIESLSVTSKHTPKNDTFHIQFEHNSSFITPKDSAILQQVAEILRRHPQAQAELIGHADATGEDHYNLWLSERRAQRLINALVQLGVRHDKLTVKGLGESEPIASNDTAAGRAENRRVEIVISVFESQRDDNNNE